MIRYSPLSSLSSNIIFIDPIERHTITNFTREYSPLRANTFLFLLPFVDSCTTNILDHRTENRTSLFLNFILPLPARRTPPLESLSGQRGGMKSLIAAGQERVWDARRGWMLGNNKNGPRATRSQCGAAAIRVMKV